jgi:hypothetical protein
LCLSTPTPPPRNILTFDFAIVLDSILDGKLLVHSLFWASSLDHHGVRSCDCTWPPFLSFVDSTFLVNSTPA